MVGHHRCRISQQSKEVNETSKECNFLCVCSHIFSLDIGIRGIYSQGLSSVMYHSYAFSILVPGAHPQVVDSHILCLD